MPLLPPEEAVTEAISASTEAVIDLREAPSTVGITLPSPAIDVMPCTSHSAPRPLAEQGRCNLGTARALTSALRKTAPR